MPVALITGCSSGFGEAIALAFAGRGYQVIATMRKPQDAPSSLKSLATEKPADFILTALDVTDASQRQQTIDLAMQRFGRIDVLSAARF